MYFIMTVTKNTELQLEASVRLGAKVFSSTGFQRHIVWVETVWTARYWNAALRQSSSLKFAQSGCAPLETGVCVCPLALIPSP